MSIREVEPVITSRRISWSEYQAKLTTQSNLVALRALDALAYDKTSASPTLGTATESLLKDRKHTAKLPQGGGIKVSPKDVASGKVLLPFSDAWYRAKSDAHGVLLPTAKLCSCCGYRDCQRPIVQHEPPVSD